MKERIQKMRIKENERNNRFVIFGFPGGLQIKNILIVVKKIG